MKALSDNTQDQRCNACGGRLSVFFQDAIDPQTGETFDVLTCVQCGLGHTAPQPQDLGRYYGVQYHGGRHGISEKLCMARRIGFVKSLARPASILDFGCGDGGFLEAATAEGWNATGVEMKPEHARSKGLQVVEHIEDTAGPFDLITLWHSLEHVKAPRETLESLLPLLANDGNIIIAVPNLASLQARVFGKRWFHLDVPRHLFHFTPTALERLLEGLGLQIVQRWNLELEIDLFGWTQSILNFVIPAKNVLFDTITHRGVPHKFGQVAASFALGTVATVLSAPLVPIAAGTSRGAVMIFAAKRR